MVDETVNGSESTDSICPWCSARYTGDPETCPSCGAALAADPATDPALPGLTAIDPAAIVRSKAQASRPRNRLLSWISGDYPDDAGTTAQAGALAPPPVEVRREIFRLELEAEVANLQAEADALMAEATAEGRAPNVGAATAAAAATVVAELDAVQIGLEEIDASLDTDPLGSESRVDDGPDEPAAAVDDEARPA
ncbi:MAG: hypothetical protein ACXW4T_05010 [Candidatus Limnocylindrales bacterium]